MGKIVSIGFTIVAIFTGMFFVYIRAFAKPPTVAATTTEIPEDWASYSSDRLKLSFKYPPAITISSDTDASLKLTLADKTLLTITTGTYSAETFRIFVTTRSSPERVETFEKEGMIVYMYTHQSDNHARHIYLSPEFNRYIHISQDDGSKNNDLLENILASLQFN